MRTAPRTSHDAAGPQPLPGPLGSGTESERLAARIGARLRRLHAVPVPGTGPLDSVTRDPWQCFLRRHLAGRLATLPLTSQDAGRLWALLDTGVSLLGADVVPRMLHHDLKPANILRRANGEIVFCDFDQARAGDPLSDLGKLWWRTFGATVTRPWQAFLSAYGQPGCSTQETVRFYLVVHCIGALSYWHDYAPARYHDHACSAQMLLAAHTGVRCTLLPRSLEVT